MHTRLSTRLVGAVVLSAASSLSLGCGGGLDLVEVTGRVSLNGEPLEGATVLFAPAEASGPSTTAMDVTGPEGNYTLMTQGRTGVAPGKYAVLVSKEHSPGGVADSEAFVMVDEEGNPIGEDVDMLRIAEESIVQGGGTAPSTQAVKVEESVEREVPAEGAVFDFDLKASAADAAELRTG